VFMRQSIASIGSLTTQPAPSRRPVHNGGIQGQVRRLGFENFILT
jgi:hypothetical protein